MKAVLVKINNEYMKEKEEPEDTKQQKRKEK